MEAQWIPRSLNERADLLSRFVDKDDWRLNPSVFRLVDAKWGPHAIDRFASYYNAQLPSFNSKFASPGCSGVDALVQDWSRENNWVCPPGGLVVDAVRDFTACSGRGTLIIPEWPSTYFWPFLRDGPSRFKSFVREVFVLPATKDLILEGPGQRQIYKSYPSGFHGCPKFRMLALRVDFGCVFRTVTDSVLSLIWHNLILIWHILSLNWHSLSLIWRALSQCGLVARALCLNRYFLLKLVISAVIV